MTEQAVTLGREKRLSFTNIVPKAANGWTGTVTGTIAESKEQVVFSFTTPELSERDGRAITFGYQNRLSIAASGKKTAADILIALNSEVATLNAGTYTIRGGGSIAQGVFTDTVISLALLKVFSGVSTVECNFTKENYLAVLQNHTALFAEQEKWDAADEAGKKAMITSAVTKTKRLVSFFKM